MFAAVASHGTIIGTAREIALIDFFRGLIPQRYEILSGAIATETKGKLDRASGQLDVMVVDTFEYPTVLRTGDLAVALAPSVLVVVESKSDLASGEKFFDALRQIGKAKLVAGPGTLTALFCFGAPAKSETLRSWLNQLMQERTHLLHEARSADANLAAYEKLSKSDIKSRRKPRTKKDLLEEVTLYNAPALPDIIVSDRGAIAIRIDDAQTSYQFYRPKKGYPSVVALASGVLGHISRAVGDPERAVKEQSFRILTTHLNAGFERAQDVPDLDVTDTQPHN
ncbi:MAG: hypothetical protein H6718_07455 [Polyangiaceae bacterium]|nr:hypothetical protein [Polyangiaceae bacterium]